MVYAYSKRGAPCRVSFIFLRRARVTSDRSDIIEKIPLPSAVVVSVPCASHRLATRAALVGLEESGSRAAVREV